MKHRKSDQTGMNNMAYVMRRQNRGRKNWDGDEAAYQKWLDAGTRSRRNTGDKRPMSVIRKALHDWVMQKMEACWDRKERWM